VTEFTPHIVLPLLLWGTLVGLDLVSVPQAMISRPFVAGTIAGWLAGDMEAGLRIGVLFELFALDVLPAGAVRYPDYGPATVVAAAFAAGTPWELSLGVSAALGLVLALLGGWSLQVVRRWNARAIQRQAAALSAGESSAIRRLQYGGVLRDAARGFILTLLGLVLASTITESVRVDRVTAVALTLVSVGAAVSAGANSAIRSSGRGARLKWLAGGLLVGSLIAAFA
jgi:mannose/fructose/N-acetylgalactosamine-specific phosphotransferase system component IIC